MAEYKPSYDKERQRLEDIIPLNSPLGMYIEPTKKCNFKCFYCMHSTRGISGGELYNSGFSLAHMDMIMFDKIVYQIMNFENQPKRICFSGLGDPLMNPDLPVMVKKLRQAGFEGRIDLITNAALLSKEVSNALIDSGLSRIQISIQGLNSKDYKEVCGVAIDFDKLVENIEYFYKKRGNTNVFIKIIDSLLKNEEDEAKFMKIFSGISDTIFVEHLVIMQQQMGDHGGRVDVMKNLNGEPFDYKEVCGIMFYFMQVSVEGETFPCSTPGLPNSFSMGNINDLSLSSIWDGNIRNKMLCKNLKDGYRSFKACKNCSSVVCINDDAENIDDCRAELLNRMKTKKEVK